MSADTRPGSQPGFQHRLAQNYQHLSARLRQAGDYAVANPVDLASRSLRVVAQESGIAAATFSRLARALGYASLEEMRESLRGSLGAGVHVFAARTAALQADPLGGGAQFARAHLAASGENITQALGVLDMDTLEQVVLRLAHAPKVVVLGALGAAGIAQYMSYLARFCSGHWEQANQLGSSLGGTLADLGPQDALVVITKPPHAPMVVKAAELARHQGSYVFVITDNHSSPVLQYSSASVIIPSPSAHFYSSYVSTLAVIEAMIGMLAYQSGSAAQDRINRVETLNRQLDEVQDG